VHTEDAMHQLIAWLDWPLAEMRSRCGRFRVEPV
jgi:hypothetical protein